jgi:RimJ/RimL family protein N-acetyltransferase
LLLFFLFFYFIKADGQAWTATMPDFNFRIDTPRLIISHYNAALDSHCQFLVDAYNDPNILLANGGISAPIPDLQTARNDIDLNNKEIDSTCYGRYLVSLKPMPSNSDSTSASSPLTSPSPELLETYTKVGLLSMKLRRNLGSPTVPDIGFALLTPFAGKGYATEAAGAFLDFFREVRGQQKFLGYCHPENEKSKAMFRRMGWVNLGLKGVAGLAPGVGIVRAWVWSLGFEEEELEGVGIMPL